MEVHVTNPELEKQLHDLARRSGLGTDDVLQEALAGFLEEFATLRNTLDSRYNDPTRGGGQPSDGDEGIEKLRAKSKSAATVPPERSRGE